MHPVARRRRRLCREPIAVDRQQQRAGDQSIPGGTLPVHRHPLFLLPVDDRLNGSANSSGTINYAAANLAGLLDTGNNASLGSGGTHFENAFTSMNNLISSVGTGTSSSNTLPYVFLITDGSQDCQTQWNGNWSGKQLRMQPVLQFSDHDRHLKLHHAQEPRNNDSGSLYSLSNHPEPDHLLQQRRYLCQQRDPRYPGRAAELRVTQILLHGKLADRYHQRADRDVRTGREHRPRYAVGGRSSYLDLPCLVPAPWRPRAAPGSTSKSRRGTRREQVPTPMTV